MSVLKIKVNGEWVNIPSIKGAKGDPGQNYTITQADYNAIAEITKTKINIPSKTSDLTNDSGFTTKTYVDGLIGNIETTLRNINEGSI